MLALWKKDQGSNAGRAGTRRIAGSPKPGLPTRVSSRGTSAYTRAPGVAQAGAATGCNSRSACGRASIAPFPCEAQPQDSYGLSRSIPPEGFNLTSPIISGPFRGSRKPSARKHSSRVQSSKVNATKIGCERGVPGFIRWRNRGFALRDGTRLLTWRGGTRIVRRHEPRRLFQQHLLPDDWKLAQRWRAAAFPEITAKRQAQASQPRIDFAWSSSSTTR